MSKNTNNNSVNENTRKNRARKAASASNASNVYIPSKEELQFVPSYVHKSCVLTKNEVEALCANFKSQFDFSKNAAFVDVEITPELAEAILRKYNTTNRKATTSQIKTYEKRMKDGDWMDNGPRVIFSKNELLINSQHTFAAILNTGLSQKVLVQTGVPDNFANIIDNDKARNVKDAAVIMLKQQQSQMGQTTVLTTKQTKALSAASDIAAKLVVGLHPNDSSRTMTPADKAELANKNSHLFGYIHEKVSLLVEALNIDNLKKQQVQLEAAFAWWALKEQSKTEALIENLLRDPHRIQNGVSSGGASSPWKKFISWYKSAPKADRTGTGRMFGMAGKAIELELSSPGTNIKSLKGWTRESQFGTSNSFSDLWEPQYPLPSNWQDYLTKK